MLLPNHIRTAVRNRQFRQLAHLDFVPKQNSPDPWMNNGRFGVVFKMRDPKTGKTYALKVIKEATAEKRDRLAAIAEAIKNYPSPYWVQYEYYPQELTVAATFGAAAATDVLLMEWVEGDTLGRHFAQRCAAADRTALARLAYAFDMLALWLLHNPFAHGDLKQDNILVRPDGSLLLVDYDGVYLPAFAGQIAHELGTQDYQHPQRTEQHFNTDIDDFSIIVISLALYAAAENPDRHATYNEGDNLLLCADDYNTLTESPLLTELKRSALPAIQQRVALLDYALALPPQGLIGLPHCIINVGNYTQVVATIIADKQAQDWYDALPENLRDAVQINLQLQAAGETVEEIDKKRREREFPERASIYDIKDKLLPRNTNEIKITAKCLNEMRYFYNRWDKNLSDISSLSGLTNLQILSLSNCKNLSDISPLRGLTNLQTLGLSGCTNLSDISPLRGLTNLRLLALGSINLCEICPLSGLTNLQGLYLVNCKNLSDISTLRGLTNLQTLNLRDCENITQAQKDSLMQALPNLKIDNEKSLNQLLQNTKVNDSFKTDKQAQDWYDALPENLRDVVQINLQLQAAGKTVEGIEKQKKYDDTIYTIKNKLLSENTNEIKITAKGLNEMHYFYNPSDENLSDISALSGLTNLQELHLNACKNLSDISALRGLPNLQTLDLSYCSVRDISPLRGLTNLQNLNLGGNKLSDISPLCDLTNLLELDLGGNKLSDISPLCDLTNLQTLRLSSASLSNISPLSGLTNLQILGLRNCKNITQVQKDSLRQALPNLHLLD